jgi:delta24-sterol reductase
MWIDPTSCYEVPRYHCGGGFSGTAGESSSFRYGFFDRTANWTEIVLANGEAVKASSNKREDLLLGPASSFGTLGVTTLLEVQLIEARSFVELAYHPVSSMAEAQKKIEEAISHASNDYLDGIMLSQRNGVICIGRLTNNADSLKIQTQANRSAVPYPRREACQETHSSNHQNRAIV